MLESKVAISACHCSRQNFAIFFGVENEFDCTRRFFNVAFFHHVIAGAGGVAESDMEHVSRSRIIVGRISGTV